MIDSTEAHCQLKVLNSTAQQDQSETLLEEGDASTINGTDTMAGIHAAAYITLYYLRLTLMIITTSKVTQTSDSIKIESIWFLSPDLNKLGSTNDKSLLPAENASVCQPTSGHLMAEKMRLGRQDGDEDSGKTLIICTVLLKSSLSIEMEA